MKVKFYILYSNKSMLQECSW